MTALLHALAVPVALVALVILAVSMVMQPLDPPYGVWTAMLTTAGVQ